MQNNNKVSQNPSLQNVPNPNVKPKFSCNICKFACSSLQNFRIHLQTAHCQASEKTQNMSAIINAETSKGTEKDPKYAAKPKGNAAENVQPAKPKGNAAENVQPAKPKGNAAVNVQPAKPIWNAVVSNVQPAKPKGNAAVNVQPGPIPDSSGRYIAPVKDYMSRADKEPLIAKPKGNAAVNVQPGPIPDSSGRYIAPLKDYMSRADKVPLIAKPNWNTAANVQPGPIPGNSGRYIAPLKDYVSRADREPLIAMPKGNAAANVQPAQLKWNAVVSNVQPGPIPDSSGRYIATLKDYVSRADREPLIGLEYVLEYRVKTTANQIETKYFCDLCECDADVDPMVEHLAGFGHRKLYLAKDYPYVLKAQSNSKEDQSRFIRRMALEIEREEGTKTYMIDSSIWMETMMTLRAASKKMKKKTRWDNDKNDQARMKKALNFLETFEIDNELEATTVARLCEKLTTNLKFFNNKARADALFPVRVARAQDVAMSLMQNAERQNTNLQNPTQKKSKPKIPPQPNKRPPAFPGNPNLNQNVGMQSGFPGPNFQNLNAGMQSGFPGPNFQNLNPGMQSGFPGPNFQNLNAGMQSGFPGPNFQNHNAGMQSGFPGPNFQNLNAGMQSGAPGPNVQNLNAGMQSGVPGQNFQNRNAGMQSGVPGQNFQNRNAGMQSGVPGQNFQNPNAGMQSGFPGQNIQNPNAGMQSGFPGRNFQNSDPPKNMPQAPLYQKPQQHPFAPSIKKQAMQGGPSMPKIKVNAPKAENTQSDAFLKDISQEDTQFFSKLMSLLEALPQNASLSDNTQMNSKLLMLKSMMVNQKSAEHEQANQKLMTQLASLVQDTISAQNASLNQQLMMLMSSQNSTSMVMQTASLRNTTMAAGTIQVNENSVMNRAGIVPGIQGLGNMQTNVNSLMPFNQNFGKQACGQMGENASRPMDRNAYQGPQVEMQTYPSTSQNYDNSVERNYLPQGDPYVRQKDGTVNSLTSGQNEKMIIPSTDVGYKPSAYDKEWDSSYYGDKSTPVPEPRYVDHTEEQTPYTRVSLSPSSAQNKYDDYTRGEVGTQDTRHRHDLNSSRSYNSSEWEDQESDMRYNKRAKLDMNDRSDRLESYNNRSLESRGINTAGMPDELLKRIQGKDLFTVSAIISEYSERRSGK